MSDAKVMHIAGKIFLALGLVITLAGVVMTSLGGSSLAELEEYEMDVKELSVWSNSDGSTDYRYNGGDMFVMVRDDVRCDTFTLTMENSTGENWYYNDECTEDGSKPLGYEDDAEGWYHMGTIYSWDYDDGEYTINSSADVELVPMWSVFGDGVAQVAGGLLGVFGGFASACCGISFMILGGIFALTLKSPEKKQVNITQEDSKFTTNTSLVGDKSKTPLVEPDWWDKKD